MIAKSTCPLVPITRSPRNHRNDYCLLGILIVSLLILTSLNYSSMTTEENPIVRYAITFGFLVLLASLTVKNLSIGVFLLMGFSPLFSVLTQKALVNSNILSYMTLLIVFIVWIRRRKMNIQRPVGQIVFLFYLCSNVVSLINTFFPDRFNSFYLFMGLSYFLEAIAMFTVIYILIPSLSSQQIEYAFSAFIFGTFIVAIWFLLEYSWGSSTFNQIDRLGLGMGINPNQFSSYCMMGIIYLTSIYRKKMKWGWRFLIIAVLGIVLFFSGTRTTMLGTIAGLLVAFTFGKRFSRSWIVQMILILMVISIGISATGIVQNNPVERQISRYTDLFSINFSDKSQMAEISSGRTIIWQVGWNAFLKNPILGVGLGRFSSISLANDTSVRSNLIGASAHNLYLSILVEQGVVGIILFVSWVFLYFRYAIRKSNWAACVLGWLVAYLLLGFSGGYAINSVFGFLLGGVCVVFESTRSIPSSHY